MSFDSNIAKPKLIEKKIVKFFKTKNIQKEPEINVNTGDSNFLVNYIKEFMIKNYGFVILFGLVTLLLYIRYLEVAKRKKNKFNL